MPCSRQWLFFFFFSFARKVLKVLTRKEETDKLNLIKIKHLITKRPMKRYYYSFCHSPSCAWNSEKPFLCKSGKNAGNVCQDYVFQNSGKDHLSVRDWQQPWSWLTTGQIELIVLNSREFSTLYWQGAYPHKAPSALAILTKTLSYLPTDPKMLVASHNLLLIHKVLLLFCLPPTHPKLWWYSQDSTPLFPK